LNFAGDRAASMDSKLDQLERGDTLRTAQRSCCTGWGLVISREQCSPLFELARVLVHFNPVANRTVNANHWTVSFITG